MRIEASGGISYMVGLLTDRPLSTQADGEKGENRTISSNPNVFLKATGLEVQAFQDLFSFLKPGENCNNIKLYEADRQLAADKMPTNQ